MTTEEPSRVASRLLRVAKPTLIIVGIVILIVDVLGALYLDSKQLALGKRLQTLEAITTPQREDIAMAAHFSRRFERFRAR